MMSYFKDLKTLAVVEQQNLSTFGVTYEVNSGLFRSPELSKVDLLISGCSQTFGIGMKKNLIWPTILAGNNISYNNLAYPGASTEAIVDNIFRHIYKFGKPKYIRVLFPDMFRFVFLENQNCVMIASNKKIDDIRFVDCQAELHKEIIKQKYYPNKIIANQVMPRAIAFRRNIFAIKKLELFCKYADIDFKWATWCPGFNGYLVKYEKDTIFNNYVEKKWSFDPAHNKFFINDNLYTEDTVCHQELKTQDPYLFLRAADYSYTKRNWHMGSHEHLHFAELLSI